MATGGLYGNASESVGLYGNTTNFGGSYFEWFIFYQSDTQPATPTGGSWSFVTNTGTPPTGWSATPFSAPTLPVWVSIALVNSRSDVALAWSAPGLFSYSSGLPILSGSGTPAVGDGINSQLYVQTSTTPQTIWFKQSGTWNRLVGSTLYADLTSAQTVAGIKTFSSPIVGSVTGTAANVTGIVDIANGGTSSTTASGARSALGVTATGQDTTYAYRANNLSDLASASTARTNLGLGSAAVLTAGAANGVATLDAGGTVPLSQIPASIQGGVSYQGTWNASTNTPTLTSSVGTKGYYYVVSTAGSTNLNGVTDWQIGDWAIFNGTIWQKIDNTDAVTSVNGYTGTVVLTQPDIAGTASLTTVQTLTNKTLTSPKINEILDTNGNEILGLSPTASATDFVTIKNGIGVGVPLHVYADGPSTNIGLHIQPKGSGLVTISDGTDFNKGIRFRSSGSAASAVTLLDAVATAGRVVTLPDATTTLVGRDTTDTLTNKTIAFGSNTFSGTLPTANGGTNLSSFTSGGVVYASSTSALATGSALTFNGSQLNVSYADTAYNAGLIVTNTTNNIASQAKIYAVNNAGDYISLGRNSTLLGGQSAIFATGNYPLEFFTDSTLRMTLTSTSLYTASGINVGIGTNNPLEKLVVNGNARILGGGYLQLFDSTNASNSGFATDATGLLQFSSTSVTRWLNNTLAVEQMRLNPTGLGIGNNNPLYKLDVEGDFRIANSIGGTLTGYFGCANTGSITLNFGGTTTPSKGRIFYTDNSDFFSFWTNSTEQIRITSAGNILKKYNTEYQSFTSGGSVSHMMSYGTWNGTGNLLVVGNTFDGIVFGTGGGTMTEKGRFTASGNFGINQNNPVNKFEVKGEFAAPSTSGSGQNGIARFSQVAGVGSLDIGFGDPYTWLQSRSSGDYSVNYALALNPNGGNVGIGTSSPSRILELKAAQSCMVFNDNTNQWTVGTGSFIDGSDNFIFYKNAVGDLMRLTGSGNLGLGVTPSAWLGSRSKMEFSSAGTIAGFVGCFDGSGANNQMGLGSNCYLNASSNWIYNNSGAAGRYEILNNAHAWFNAPSGTAGNAIAFTQAMTLDASGNLGVGTTSIDAKLNVAGTIGVGTTTAKIRRNQVSGSTGLFIQGNANDTVSDTNPGAYIGIGGGPLTDGYEGNISIVAYGATTDNNRNQITFSNRSGTNTVTERARIDSSGNLLVGKTSSGAANVGFEVNQTGISYLSNSATTDATSTNHIYSTGASAFRFYVGLGGTVFATSIVISAISDQRLKENVRDIDTGLDAIMALQPRRFDWKDGKGQDKKNVAGFIAQEFETVFPECVGVSKAGADGIEYKNINHETLIPTLVKAIQEQQAIIESLKARLDAANL